MPFGSNILNLAVTIAPRSGRMITTPTSGKLGCFSWTRWKETGESEIDFIKKFGRLELITGILGNETDGGKSFKTLSKFAERKRAEKIKDFSKSNGSATAKKVKQYDLNKNFIREFDSAAQAAREIGIKYSSGICAACNSVRPNINGYAHGFYWAWGFGSSYKRKERKSKSKIYYQYSLDGKFIQSFLGTKYATAATGSLRKSITYSISNKGVCSNGFRWFSSFQGLQTNEPVRPKQERKIYQYSSEGLFIQEFESIRIAQESSGIKTLGIRLRKNQRILNNFQWFTEYQGERVDSIELFLRKLGQIGENLERQYMTRNVVNRKLKMVEQLNPETKEIIKVWNSVGEISEFFGFSPQVLRSAIRGAFKNGKHYDVKCGGFYWRYVP